jgi:hypothetical protein
LVLLFCPGIKRRAAKGEPRKRREGYKEVSLIMRKFIAVLVIIAMAVVGMAGA